MAKIWAVAYWPPGSLVPMRAAGGVLGAVPPANTEEWFA